MLLPFFPSSFCNKAVLVQGRMAFSGSTHVNPSYKRQLSTWFYMGLCARGRMGHMVIINHSLKWR